VSSGLSPEPLKLAIRVQVLEAPTAETPIDGGAAIKSAAIAMRKLA
jgi:hypothetical protein